MPNNIGVSPAVRPWHVSQLCARPPVGTCAVKRTLLRGAVRSDAQFTSAAARSNMRTNQQPAGIELKLVWPMVKA